GGTEKCFRVEPRLLLALHGCRNRFCIIASTVEGARNLRTGDMGVRSRRNRSARFAFERLCPRGAPVAATDATSSTTGAGASPGKITGDALFHLRHMYRTRRHDRTKQSPRWCWFLPGPTRCEL